LEFWSSFGAEERVWQVIAELHASRTRTRTSLGLNPHPRHTSDIDAQTPTAS
jgi:hypothetical protein